MLSRRNFLKGFLKEEIETVKLRPPWTNEASLSANCISCGDCITACPENILFTDDRGHPVVSFDGNECTFCMACVESCNEEVFDTQQEKPWPVTVAINDKCLLYSGITCQLCTDSCDAGALVFDLRARREDAPSGTVRLDTEICTGCGACTATCPVSAIEIIDQRMEQAA